MTLAQLQTLQTELNTCTSTIAPSAVLRGAGGVVQLLQDVIKDAQKHIATAIHQLGG